MQDRCRPGSTRWREESADQRRKVSQHRDTGEVVKKTMGTMGAREGRREERELISRTVEYATWASGEEPEKPKVQMYSEHSQVLKYAYKRNEWEDWMIWIDDHLTCTSEVPDKS